MLGNADDVAAGDLRNSNVVLCSGCEIDVVGTDSCGQNQAQVVSTLDALSCDVCRPEWRGDYHVRIFDVLVEFGFEFDRRTDGTDDP